MGCKREDAIITPVALAIERRNGHQLERRHAHCCEVLELLARAIEAALSREAAEMRLVENRLSPWPPAPVRMLPAVGQGSHDDARSMHVARLAAGRGIRHAHALIGLELI